LTPTYIGCLIRWHHITVQAKVSMYKKIHIFLCTAFLLGACAAPTLVPTATPVPTQPPSPTPAVWEREGWNIVWHDEFEGPELDL
jgi:uncharacterized lipoprotein YajG